jgi:hypothetical protein
MHSIVKLYAGNPLQAGLDALSLLLEDYHYSQTAREAIVTYTAVHGTPSGNEFLDAEDEHDANMVFEESLPAVPYDSPEWGDPLDEATLISHEAPDGRHVARKMMDAGSLPPIAGGGPEFIPSAEDLADYAAWAEELDRREEIRQAELRHNPEFGYE